MCTSALRCSGADETIVLVTRAKFSSWKMLLYFNKTNSTGPLLFLELLLYFLVNFRQCFETDCSLVRETRFDPYLLQCSSEFPKNGTYLFKYGWKVGSVLLTLPDSYQNITESEKTWPHPLLSNVGTKFSRLNLSNYRKNSLRKLKFPQNQKQLK